MTSPALVLVLIDIFILSSLCGGFYFAFNPKSSFIETKSIRNKLKKVIDKDYNDKLKNWEYHKAKKVSKFEHFNFRQKVFFHIVPDLYRTTDKKKESWFFYEENVINSEKIKDFYNKTVFKMRKQLFDDLQKEQENQVIDLELDIENLRLESK